MAEAEAEGGTGAAGAERPSGLGGRWPSMPDAQGDGDASFGGCGSGLGLGTCRSARSGGRAGGSGCSGSGVAPALLRARNTSSRELPRSPEISRDLPGPKAREISRCELRSSSGAPASASSRAAEAEGSCVGGDGGGDSGGRCDGGDRGDRGGSAD